MDLKISKSGTIVAWAGGSSPAALAIVRLSGNNAHAIARAICVREPDSTEFRGSNPVAFHTELMRPGTLSDKGSSYEQHSDAAKLIDNCITIWYRAPRSYTGEDMVEFSIHGNPLLGREVVETLIALGAREAGPGEFTARAFLNGKLDLTQAEAVQELIAARSRSQVELARNMLAGGLRDAVNKWYERLVKMRAELEVIFDYPGETSDVTRARAPGPNGESIAAAAHVSDDAERDGMRETIAEITTEIGELIAYYDRGKVIREGIRVAIAGAPNVGKSSLFNALCGFDRALTDYEPGTTRDYLELTLGWDKLTLTLIDTAGLRTDAERVEAAGIERTEEVISEADVVLYVIDTSACVDPKSDLLGAPSVGDRQKLVHIFNKVDLLPDDELASLSEKIGEHPEFTVFITSVKSGRGIAEIRRWLIESLSVEDTADRVLITERHYALVNAALKALDQASESLRQGVPTDIVTIDITEAQNALAAITGRDVLTDVLDTIFANFCVGK